MQTQKSRQASRFQRFNKVIRLIKEGEYEFLSNEMKKRVGSQSISVGLRRDLTVPFEAPNAKIELNVRPFRAEDTDILIREEDMDLLEIWNQKSLIDANFKQCYVATTQEDVPCYMQWLVGPYDNDYYPFEGTFPQLESDEALLEGAFVPPAFRGQWIMPAAMARIAEMGHKAHAGSLPSWILRIYPH